MRAGFRYLFAWKGGMMMIGVAVVVKFFLNPAFSLLPILAVKHFHGGALEMGWLDAARVSARWRAECYCRCGAGSGVRS